MEKSATHISVSYRRRLSITFLILMAVLILILSGSSMSDHPRDIARNVHAVTCRDDDVCLQAVKKYSFDCFRLHDHSTRYFDNFNEFGYGECLKERSEGKFPYFR